MFQTPIKVQPTDCWDSFPLFQLLNDFFNTSSKIFFCFLHQFYSISEALCLGRFHTHLMDVYAPMVIRYIGEIFHIFIIYPNCFYKNLRSSVLLLD